MNGDEKEPMLNKPAEEQIDSSADKFGFGVPDEKVELDPDIFDDEFDTKKAFRFDKAQKFENGVGKEFEKMKSGEIPTFYHDEDEPEEMNWSKMPSSLNEFNSLRLAVAQQIFGDKPDRILEGINKFMADFYRFRQGLKDNFFPSAVLSLLYLPFYLVVMLLNCVKEAIMWWIVAIIILMVFCAIIGALSTLALTAYRGYKIYNSRFGDDAKAEEDPAQTEASSDQHEGGEAEEDFECSSQESCDSESSLNEIRKKILNSKDECYNWTSINSEVDSVKQRKSV